MKERIDQPLAPLSSEERHNALTTRARRWYRVGYKDGLCGLLWPLGRIPKKYRQYYCMGHTQGMFVREIA